MVVTGNHLHWVKFTYMSIWQNLTLNTSLIYYLHNFLHVYITKQTMLVYKQY